MLVVAALGGNALLSRGKAMTADNQRALVRAAAHALAPVAARHQLVVGHGSGPQAGLLALQGGAYAEVETCPLDLVATQTEWMFGYLIEQELGNLLPPHRPFATVLTMVEVDANDPAFRNPTKCIGPVYLREEAERLARTHGWSFKASGDKWRRAVASPEPKRILELCPIKWLLAQNTIVIAAGGGGIPTMCTKGADRKLTGAECVIDRNLVSELLARELAADLLVMLTDADAVYAAFGTRAQRAIRRAPPEAFATLRFAGGSMAAKVDAACRFAKATGRKAAIGALADLGKIVEGQAGTTISADERALVYEEAANDVACG
jgi:carbamate kinase